MVHRKTLLGRKKLLASITLSLPQLFPESDSLLHMGMLPKLLSYSGEETERSATSRGQPEAWVLRGCSTLPALSFFGWHNASEFHRTQLQKTRVWIISRHSHFSGMRTSIFKSFLFLPFSLESIKPNSTKSIRRVDCPSENDVAQVNDMSQTFYCYNTMANGNLEGVYLAWVHITLFTTGKSGQKLKQDRKLEAGSDAEATNGLFVLLSHRT